MSGLQTIDRPAPRRGRSALRRGLVVGVSVLAHVAALQLILWYEAPRPDAPDPPAVTVALMPPPRVEPPPPPPPPEVPAEKPGGAPDAPSPEPPTPAPASRARPAKLPPPPTQATIAASPVPAREAFLELGEAQAGAASGNGDGDGTGSGDGRGDGDGCNMVRRLQTALSRNARVKSAVQQATGARGSTGRGMVVWNGDWVASTGEEGKGLATLRQAIAWEVGFAPKACREQAVRGYVLVRLDANNRIALGTGAWRWSDLLGLR